MYKKIALSFLALVFLFVQLVVPGARVKASVITDGSIQATTVKSDGTNYCIPIEVINEKVFAGAGGVLNNYDKFVLYTWEYGLKTDTPGYGTYIVVENGVVKTRISKSQATDKVDIPLNGFVIYIRHSSSSSTKPAQLYNNFLIGQTVNLTGYAVKAVAAKAIVPKANVNQQNKPFIQIDDVNKTRVNGKKFAYTLNYGLTTGTTGSTTNSAEVTVQRETSTGWDKVVAIGISNSNIPQNGYVLSFSGAQADVDEFTSSFAIGDYVRTTGFDYLAIPQANVTNSTGSSVSLNLTSINANPRTVDNYTLYTPSFGLTTNTNANGVEVIVENGKVTRIDTSKGNNAIPANGFVLSTESNTNAAMESTLSNLKVGSTVNITGLNIPRYIGAVSNGTSRVFVHKVNGNRDSDTVVIYTPDYGMTTKTGNYGVEIVVDRGKVVQVIDGRKAPNTNAAIIPLNGYVISTIDTSGTNTLRDALVNNFPVGTSVSLEAIDLNPVKNVTTDITRLDPNGGNDFPGYRGANELVVYTPAYGKPTTGTNTFGTEVIVVNGRVTEQSGYDSTIPSNGFVVSGHGTAKDWINSNMILGAKVTLDAANMKLNVVVDSQVFISLAETEINNSALAIDNAVKASADAPLETAKQVLDQAKAKVQSAKDIAGSNDSEAIALAKEAKALALKAYYNTVPSKTVEARGVWHRPTEKTIEQVRATLDKFASANINMVFLETFYNGYTIYPSSIADTRPEFANIGFDLLKAYIEEGKARGIEVHAWVEDFYVGNKVFANDINKDGIIDVSAGESTGSPIIDKHPDWAAKMKNGSYYLKTESGYTFMNAAMPEVRDYLSSLYKEIVSKYDVAGLQLDYIRYPLTNDDNDGVGYDDYSRAQFKSQYGIDPIDIVKATDSANWAKFNLWKQNNITTFVERIHNEVKGIRNILISTAVFPELDHAIDQKSQNWGAWIDKGYLDFISPMAYQDYPETVKENVGFMVDNYGKINNYAGISPMFHKLAPVESVKQVIATREAGAKGVVFFDSKDLSPDQIEALVQGPFRTKAALPELTIAPKSIADIVKQADDKANITVDVTGNAKVDKNVFDAIKGTEKTVTFNNGDAAWTFNGKDMAGNTKELDLSVSVGAANDAIKEAAGNVDVAVIAFADNGILPGKAEVKVKLSQEWLKGKDSSHLNVYYFNPETKAFEVIAENIKSDENGYISFTITHNSDYVVSDKNLIANNSVPTGNKEEKATVLPKTGAAVDFTNLIVLGLLLAVGGVYLTLRKRA